MWDRCWAIAVVRLGLTSEQFFESTPRQLRVLANMDRERIEEQRRHNELCAAIIAHTEATFAGKVLKDSASLTYGDFMPSMKDELRKSRQEASAVAFRGFLEGLAIEAGLKK